MRESTDATRLGRNRTGLQASPRQAQRMTDNVEPVTPESAESSPLNQVRLDYIRDADPLGSVPPPATAKGKLKDGAEMLTGDRPQAFVDKLAERLAFERGGTRLYDAVIAKFLAHEGELDGVTVQDVAQIRDEEAQHAALLRACMEQLGADPTAQTPAADLVGVESAGLLQAASDPRTTLAQTLHATLAAELIDGAGWESLIAMAESMGQGAMAERFRNALDQEHEHLAKVRGWYDQLTMQTARLM
ncbi:MAG TPA: ferritin-like domain-containing protein [Steroidobacter sp.]